MKILLLFILIFILSACSPGAVVQTPLPTETQILPTVTSLNMPSETVLPLNLEDENGEEMSLGSIVVPLGSLPNIDGTIAPGEWDDAIVEIFADGSQLFLLYADGYLYLGIRTYQTEVIAGNVFIEHGDQISIMHTSAALGTAVYQKSEENWYQVRDFSWSCRNTSNNDSALDERADFLQNEGWLAANGLMGTPNELEYKIRIESLKDYIRLAVVYIKSSYPYDKVPWPANLDDDSIKPTPNGLPEILSFSIDQWKLIQVDE